MTTNLTELRALLAKATPLPWTSDSLGGRDICDDPSGFYLESVSSPFARALTSDDNAFTVAGLNALPDLLAVAEAAQRLRNASKAIEAWIEDPGEGLGSHDRMMSLTQEYNKAANETDAALSRLTTPQKETT